MKKTLSIFCLFFLIILQACTNDDETQVPVVNDSYYTVTNNISILKEEAIQYIQEKVVGDSLIIFSNNTPEDALPKAGTHLYIPISTKTPYGMLVKVISIERDSSIKVKTEALPLEEAFEDLSVDTTLTVISDFEGIFDEAGNPIEYEIVEKAAIEESNWDEIRQMTTSAMARESSTSEWDLTKECLKFPIKLYKGFHEKDTISIDGMICVGFDQFDLDINVNKFKVNNIGLNATPYIRLIAESTVTTESQIEFSERIGQLRFKLKIPTPVGIPVIAPVTLYLYETGGFNGQMSAKLGLQYQYNCHCSAAYQEGQWTTNATHGGFKNQIPWLVNEFDVQGELFAETKLGLLVGLYSATTGIGFNITPKFSLSAHATLASPNLLEANPEVGLNLLVGGDVYCVAKIFGKNLGKYSYEFPDYSLWSANLTLLPKVFLTTYSIPPGQTYLDLGWQYNRNYLLHSMGIKTGITVYESDQVTEICSYSYTQSPQYYEEMFGYMYKVNPISINPGTTYYVALFVEWNGFRWYTNKISIKTTQGPNTIGIIRPLTPPPPPTSEVYQ